jgi:predicted nucleic acid-binding protein
VSVVVDASVVVAALVDSGPVGEWAIERLRGRPLCAPHLLPAEVADVMRRAEAAGELFADVASLAFADLLDLAVDLYPFDPLAARVWDLRPTINAYDAWYVALAEALDGPLVTLDDRLASAPGPECRFEVPEL